MLSASLLAAFGKRYARCSPLSLRYFVLLKFGGVRSAPSMRPDVLRSLLDVAAAIVDVAEVAADVQLGADRLACP